MDAGVDGTPPIWSPDGTRLAFSRLEGETYDLYTIATDGSDLQRLTDNVVHDIDGVWSWSPDGGTMAFTTERDANQEIYIMSPDGTNPINLTQDAGRDQRPTWTPAR